MNAVLRGLYRALWHAQRTPVAPLTKGVLRAVHAGSCRHRQRLGRAIHISPEAAVAAASLAADGFAWLDNVISADALCALNEYALGRLESGATGSADGNHTRKGFWTRLSDGDAHGGALPHTHPMVQFAIQNGLVAFLARSYGEVPQLSEVLLSLSKHTPGPITYSQLWHRDHDDVKTVKVFVYHTDVDSAEDGPFTFAPGQASDRLRLTLRSHLPDALLYNHVHPEEVREIKAKRLSCFAVETSRCWHMGSRVAEGRHRLMYTATYIRYPRVYGEPPPRFRTDAAVDEVTRALLFRN